MRRFTFFVLLSFTCCISILGQKLNIVLVHGTVVDKKDQFPLVFANVNIGDIGTTTNMDGQFVLAVEEPLKHKQLTIKYIGYTTKNVDIKNKEMVISLDSSPGNYDNFDIYSADEIVQDLNNNIHVNHSYENQLLSAYYKETILASNEPSYIAEGVFSIFQPTVYSKEKTTVEVIKTRKRELQPLDSTDLPMISGHATDMIEGANRRKGSFLDIEEKDNYNFTKEELTVYDGREVYIVSFQPKNRKGTSKGLLYIDSNSKAIIKAEYFPVLDNQYFWTNVKWTEEYAEQGGIWDLRRVSYHGEWETNGETFAFQALLVVTDVKNVSEKPAITNELAAHAIFFHEVPQLADDFWDGYNFVQLTEKEKITFGE